MLLINLKHLLVWWLIGFTAILICNYKRHKELIVDDVVSAFFAGFLGLYAAYRSIEELAAENPKFMRILKKRVI